MPGSARGSGRDDRTARPQEASIANAGINLAKLLVQTDCAGEALDLATQALKLRRNINGSDSPEAIDCARAHAKALVALGQANEGLALFQCASQARERGANGSWIADIQRDGHRQTAKPISATNLGSVSV